MQKKEARLNIPRYYLRPRAEIYIYIEREDLFARRRFCRKIDIPQEQRCCIENAVEKSFLGQKQRKSAVRVSRISPPVLKRD